MTTPFATKYEQFIKQEFGIPRHCNCGWCQQKPWWASSWLCQRQKKGAEPFNHIRKNGGKLVATILDICLADYSILTDKEKYNLVGDRISEYARQNEFNFSVTEDHPPKNFSMDAKDVWYIYNAWLKRKYGSWYSKAVERIRLVAWDRVFVRFNIQESR